MKKVLLFAIVFVCFNVSFGQAKKYVTFEADIANRNGDYISILNEKGKMIKKIPVNKEGFFKDTLNVETNRYVLTDGNEYTILYLKNGFDLKLKMNTQKFDESIVYTGKGALENNFLAQNSLFEEKTDMAALLASNEAVFNKGLEEKKTADLKRLENKKLEPYFVVLQKKSIDDNFLQTSNYYKENQTKSKLNNTVAPTFNYLNHKGGTTKLEDFKGKYVYIDVWATWCGPCRAEIPFLKQVEEKYHNKSIVFVSISVDVDKDFEKWKTMVKDKELGGVQLFADKNWNSDFMRSFGINSIPRFILIDPNGKVVKADASRPSSVELQKELDKLLN